MRWDYISYIVGMLFFGTFLYLILNRSSTEAQIGGLLIYGAVVFVLVLFAATSFIFGYELRPKKR
jgi:hypothetical protein